MSFPLLKCMNPEYWDFKAEGFDSIILSWVGPTNSEFYLKTLRLYKNQNEGYRRGDAKPISDFTDRVIIFQRYIDIFIRPYFPEIDSGIPVSVNQEFLEKIAKKVETLRSDKRRAESYICTTSKVALIHDDHIPPNSLVVELKPKWGFLPTCPLIQSDSPKLSISHFQMLQRSKLKKGEISKISQYDPLDLFSGTKDGIKKAIESLTENPQGNLKIFRDQKKSKLEQNEVEKLIQIIFDDLSQNSLKRLLDIQYLDVWDIECLPPIIRKAGNVTWNDLISDQKVIDGVKKMINEKYRLPKSKEEIIKLRDNLTQEEARIFIAAFCLSQSAKDCSYMILFENQKLINPKIFIFDFDMKMPELLISSYLEKDKNTIQTYIEMESKSHSIH